METSLINKVVRQPEEAVMESLTDVINQKVEIAF